MWRTMKNDLVQIVNRNQISKWDVLHFKFVDEESNTRSFIPSITFSMGLIKAVYCDMDILTKGTIKEYLEQPGFDPESEDIEEITDDDKPIYVQYKYWLKFKDDEGTYRLSKDEYQRILYTTFDDSIWYDEAKYPTIEELKKYVKEKE